MRCLILKLQGPKLEKCRSYLTKRYINYNEALRPNILVVWGAYAIFKNGCLATSGATVGERNKVELMTSQNIKLRIICKVGDKSDCILHWPKV